MLPEMEVNYSYRTQEKTEEAYEYYCAVCEIEVEHQHVVEDNGNCFCPLCESELVCSLKEEVNYESDWDDWDDDPVF